MNGQARRFGASHLNLFLKKDIFMRPLSTLALSALIPCLGATSTALAQIAPTAEYEIVFDATWSEETHPQDFPSNDHFSGLIGGTHNGDILFWNLGELASPGIEQMAETGGKTLLTAEVQAEIALGNAGEVISGPGIGAGIGTASDTFTASLDFPYATVVSMIAPSPDWFVGVSGTLLLQDGQWANEIVIELYPYDSGTDSGTTYTSPNQNTIPPELIFQITGYPFLADDGMTVNPLGTFTFRRIGYCPQDINESGAIDTADLLALLAAWGESGDIPEDVNGDGVVNTADLLDLLAAWGAC